MYTHQLLYLWGLDDASGLPVASLRPVFGQILLAGVAASLAGLGRITFDGDRIDVRDATPPGEPAMDAVLAALHGDARARRVPDAGRRLIAAVTITAKCAEGLARAGVLEVTTSRMLLVFTRTHTAIRDPAAVAAARARIAGGDGAEVALVLAGVGGLLEALGHPAVPSDGSGPARMLERGIAGTRRGVSPQI